jgi:hypothetical protein
MPVRLPAAAYIAGEDSPNPASTTRLLLLPDLGTAPVTRLRCCLMRAARASGPVEGSSGTTACAGRELGGGRCAS